MGDSAEASRLFRQLETQQVIQPATPDAMSLDPHRASVVVDLLESATRAGSLEKQEAAAILSSWIEEQKQVRSNSSSPGPDAEPNQTSSQQPPQPPPPPLHSSKNGPTASTTMTIKTTTMTTTTSPSPTPPPPAQLPGSPMVTNGSNVGTLRDAAASLTPKSIRRLSRQLPATSKPCSMPNTPTAASATRQFSFSSQQASSKATKTTTSTTIATTTNAADGRKTPQRQRRRSQQQQQQQPMRSLFHKFASCAIGERGSDESGESDSAARRRRRAEVCNTAPVQHRFYLDPLPPPPPPPPLPPAPPAPPMPPPSLGATLPPPRPASSTSSDSQAYALYDPAGAEQNTYCYIDESDLAESCLPAPAGDAAAAAESEAKKTAKESGWSPSGTSDSGVYGSGLRFETPDEAIYN